MMRIEVRDIDGFPDMKLNVNYPVLMPRLRQLRAEQTSSSLVAQLKS